MTAEQHRSPVPWALGIVVALTAIGVLLRWWGPINPALSTSQSVAGGDGSGSSTAGPGATSASLEAGLHGIVRVTVDVGNHAHTDVDLTAVRLDRGETTPGGDWPTVTTSGVPAPLDAGESATVGASLDFRGVCAAHPGAERTFAVVVDAKTMSGFTKTVNGNHSVTISCPDQIMPPPGRPPKDPEGARKAVTETFATAYDASAAPAARRASVDDPRGLAPLVRQVTDDDQYSTYVDELAAQVDDIVFTSPSEAVVSFRLDPTGLGNEIGHARRVDGHWKVTRATVCADLARVGYECPGP